MNWNDDSNYNENTEQNELQNDDSPDLNQDEYQGSTQQPVKREKETKHTKEKKQPGKGSMVLSGVIGGLVVAMIGAVLLFTSVIPIDSDQNTASTSNSTTDSSSNPQSGANIVQTASTNETSLTEAIDGISKAVVGVTNIQQQSLFGETQQAGAGSGVIYKKEDGKAYVVTNNHVVEGSNEVEVILNEGKHVSAKILGTDPLTDLAVLEIDAKNVKQVAKLGSSEKLTVGQTTIAIGNPLGQEFANSVTKGIISGLKRSVPIDLNKDGQQDWVTEAIQTDAAINPGNSGGALVNSKGQVIGINSMKIAQEAVEGIGFAIPIDTAKPIIKQLETQGEVTRPFIGVGTVSLSQVPKQQRQQKLNLPEDVKKGMIVAQVEPGSPASDADLQQYDVVTKINDKEVTSVIDLRKYLYTETKVGEEVSITFYRDGNQQSTQLTLSEK